MGCSKLSSLGYLRSNSSDSGFSIFCWSLLAGSCIVLLYGHYSVWALFSKVISDWPRNQEPPGRS